MGEIAFSHSCRGVARALPVQFKTLFLFLEASKKRNGILEFQREKDALNRTLAWLAPSSDPLSRESSVCLRCNADYSLRRVRRLDGGRRQLGTRKAPSPRPRLYVSNPRPASSPSGGAGGRGASAPLLVGVPRGPRKPLGRFFFQAPPGFFLTKSKRNGVEGLQVLPALSKEVKSINSHQAPLAPAHIRKPIKKPHQLPARFFP